MGSNKLSPEIVSLLEKAVNDDIDSYNVVIHDENAAGQGYLGELVFLSLTNKKTNEELQLALKQVVKTPSSNDVDLMEIVFFNEIYFYQHIWKTFDEFQKKFPNLKPFDKIPKCLATNNDTGNEKILMENLKYSGYGMFPRDCAFDEKQTEFLMKSYGQFHGISAAYRESNQEVYKSLMSKLKNGSESVMKLNFFKEYTLICMRRWTDMVKNDLIKQKLEKYCEDGVEMVKVEYKGKNPVFNHGDCWSNNIMVKFDDNGVISDIRLIDFQMCSCGSVVSDLSYMLYSGASPNVIRNLDKFLKIYHDSFSDILRKCYLDPSKIFTFEDLKQEWKLYCKPGFFYGQMMWNSKLTKTIEKRSLVEIHADDEVVVGERNYEIDLERLEEVLLNLAEHLNNNDYL